MPSRLRPAPAVCLLTLLATAVACGDQSRSPSLIADTGPQPDIPDRDTTEDASANIDVPNRAPTTATDFAALLEGNTTTVDVLQNDTDPDGDPLSIASLTPAARGTATLSNGNVEFQAPADYNGEVRLNYEINDDHGHSSTGQLLIGVYEQLDAPTDAPVIDLPRQSIRPRELAVVVNENDSYSTAIANTYKTRRNIPSENIIRVTLPADGAVVQPAEFEPIREAIESASPNHTQGYLLTWLEPYRVGCMSITSALAVGGYDAQYCNTSPDQPCTRTAPVDYFNSETTRPSAEHDIEPAMMLALQDEQTAESVIDSGVAADNTFPDGEGFFVRTSDSARSSRWPDLQSTAMAWDRPDGLDVTYIDNSDGSGSNLVRDESDVLFYFTGLASVADIDTNTYRPGAVADHLTSFAGRLSNFGGQMSAVEWLRAGATASYGTVVEPCNFPQKFPRPSVLLEHYFRGNTLLEAYWKSVRWPGEGVFVGEPLASPWGRSFISFSEDTVRIRTTLLDPEQTYELIGRQTPGTSAQTLRSDISIDNPKMHTIEVSAPSFPLIQLRPTN